MAASTSISIRVELDFDIEDDDFGCNSRRWQ